LPNELDALQLACDAVDNGAIGVDMGRNIWQSDYPVAMIRAVRAIVHENSNVKEANDIFFKEKEFEQQRVIKPA